MVQTSRDGTNADCESQRLATTGKALTSVAPVGVTDSGDGERLLSMVTYFLYSMPFDEVYPCEPASMQCAGDVVAGEKRHRA
jgi:hypothetical protein